ncbi:hypothetical protein [Candidatus Halocynthiibacter alkanivorans]|uniref:hypothetical protein n=1 Tax=Candidatus Halocynthiibacter alkanivorans TaxID=2267619 RepID=UPI000DF33D66|nr:hypothetical protein [Candidatus Halocynthiibacter alkanivorans]
MADHLNAEAAQTEAQETMTGVPENLAELRRRSAMRRSGPPGLSNVQTNPSGQGGAPYGCAPISVGVNSTCLPQPLSARAIELG